METNEPKTKKPKFPLLKALGVAEEILAELATSCSLLTLAGSIRRRKAEVGDVEILYVPLVQLRLLPINTDLFGEGPKTEIDLAVEVLEKLLARGVIGLRLDANGRTTWGKRNRLAVHTATGIPVDFFAATKTNWFNYLVCRTGPASLNVKISQQAKKYGLKWHPYDEGFTDADGKVLPVKSEQEVFEMVGLPSLEPEERGRP